MAQLGSVIVPVVVGIVYQQTNSLYAAFVALAIGPLLATVMMFPVRERHLF
jgi:ACS family glucarate transporter-like MFS transporter